jgi:hypothetical protein
VLLSKGTQPLAGQPSGLRLVLQIVQLAEEGEPLCRQLRPRLQGLAVGAQRLGVAMTSTAPAAPLRFRLSASHSKTPSIPSMRSVSLVVLGHIELEDADSHPGKTSR